MIDINDLTFQSSAQRDFVVMATRTPQREESTSALDKEWVTEHARQVGKEGRGSVPVHTHVVLRHAVLIQSVYEVN